MNPLVAPTLALTALWLAALTLVVLVLVRQVALLTVRFELAGPRFSPEEDGIDVGREIPQEVREEIPEVSVGLGYVVLLSAICAPCREVAVDLGRRALGENVIILLTGPDELADGLFSMLPKWARTVRDPEALDLAKSLQIRSTPFALEIDSGRVTGKAYLRTFGDLLRLVEARHARRTRTIREAEKVIGNVG